MHWESSRKIPGLSIIVKTLDRGRKFKEERDVVETYPVGICTFKVNNRNTRTRFEIYSKLSSKTPEWRHWRRSDVIIVNFEHISHFSLLFILLTMRR